GIRDFHVTGVQTCALPILLDNKEHVQATGTYRPELIRGEVKFEHVWFAYNDNDYVLRDINLEIREGETVALVGATGAGKSSVIKLGGASCRERGRRTRGGV